MMLFIFRMLTPLMFFFAVIMFLSDFRPVSIAFAVAGYVSYLIASELSASG